jgi:hypothetical protein
MSFPARAYPDQVELALVHSRDNVNDKSQTIVDLMGGNQVKNYDMGGMGSNALKDLGLVSVIAGKECFFLSGSRIDHKDIRDTKQTLNANSNITSSPANTAMMGAGLTEEIRLDLSLLRAVGANIVNMPALMTEIQSIMLNPQNYSSETIQKLDGLLTDISTLRQLSELGVMPDAQMRIQSMIENISIRIADTSLALFDTQSISKTMLQFVSGMVANIVSQAGIESPILEQKLIAMDGRLNEGVYLEQSLNAVKESLQLALKNPDITDEQKTQILDVLNAINAHENQNGNILNITLAIAKLSPSIAELLPPLQSQNIAILLSTAVDAIHVKAASDLGVSIDQIRTIDTAMHSIAVTAQDLSQKLELLSPAEREILVQMNATLQSFAQSPLSLMAVADLTKLQSILSTPSMINGVEINVDNFKSISPQMVEGLIKVVESALPITVSILAEKWNMAPSNISLIATILANTAIEFRTELTQTQNTERRQEIIEQINGIVALQLNPMSMAGFDTTTKLLQSPVLDIIQVGSPTLPSPLEALLLLRDTQDRVVVGQGLDVSSEAKFSNNFDSKPIAADNIISLYPYLPAFQQTNLGDYILNRPAPIVTQDKGLSNTPKLSLVAGEAVVPISTKSGSELNKDSSPVSLMPSGAIVESKSVVVEDKAIVQHNENIKPVDQKLVEVKVETNNVPTTQQNLEIVKPAEQIQSVENKSIPVSDPKVIPLSPVEFKKPDVINPTLLNNDNKNEVDKKPTGPCGPCNGNCANCAVDFAKVAGAIDPEETKFLEQRTEAIRDLGRPVLKELEQTLGVDTKQAVQIYAEAKSAVGTEKLQALIEQTGSAATALQTIQKAIHLETSSANVDMKNTVTTDNKAAQDSLQNKVDEARQQELKQKSFMDRIKEGITNLTKEAEKRFCPAGYGAGAKPDMTGNNPKVITEVPQMISLKGADAQTITENLGGFQATTTRTRMRAPKI